MHASLTGSLDRWLGHPYLGLGWVMVCNARERLADNWPAASLTICMRREGCRMVIV